MRVVAYRTVPHPFPLRPAPARRDWMDETAYKFAYRCLPLMIANQTGWELLNPYAFEALWNGGRSERAITVRSLEDTVDAPTLAKAIKSHFGHGVLSWRPGYLFETEHPYDMYVTGPPNCRKDGIVALTGVVETEWLPFPFTMNWAFTRPGVPIRFEKDEPICHIFPFDRDAIERVEPEIRDIASRPDLAEHFEHWRDRRTSFIDDLRTDGTGAMRDRGWQRFYTEGKDATGVRAAPSRHKTRLHLKPFTE